jgi:hypothetical protein
MPLLTTTLTRSNNLQARYPQDVRHKGVRLPGGVNYAAGQVLGEFTTPQRNEVQTLTVNATGGTYRLGLDGQFTTPLAHNANQAAIQAAIDALLAPGNCTVGGTGPFTFTFGQEYGNRNVAVLQVDAGAATGGTPAIVKTTPGSAGATGTMAAVVSGASDGTQIAKAVLLLNTRTNSRGMVINEFGQEVDHGAPVAYRGEFYCGDLIGLTSTFAGHLGKLVDGSAITDAGAVLAIGY